MVCVVLLLSCAVLLLAGCGSKDTESTVQQILLTDQEKLIGKLSKGEVTLFALDFQKDIQGVVLWKDMWQDGECVKSELISCQDAEKLKNICVSAQDYFSPDDEMTINSRWWIVLSGPKWSEPFMPEEYTQFRREKEFEKLTWNFSRGATLGGGKVIPLQAGESYLLRVQEFDLTDSGMHAVSDKNVMLEAEFLQQDDVVIALRMDTYATKAEAEAAAEQAK